MFEFKNAKGITIFLNIDPNLIQKIIPSDIQGCTTISYQHGSISGNVQYVIVQGFPEEVYAKLFGEAQDNHNNSAYWKEKYNTLLKQSEEMRKELLQLRYMKDEQVSSINILNAKHTALLEQHGGQLQYLRKIKTELEERNISLSKQLGEMNERLKEQCTKNQKYIERIAMLTQQLKEASQELEETNGSLIKDLNESRESNINLSARCAELEHKLKEAVHEYGHADLENNKLALENKRIHQELDYALKKYNELESKVRNILTPCTSC